FTFICLLPAMLMRDFTPSNELRYLSIADEAIANGNVFAFTNHGLAYADKPPLYFWIVMLCRLVFGEHSCLALSMFSLIPAFVIVKIMDSWVMKGASVQDRMAVAMMLLTSVMFLGTAVVLRMDMLMCMFIVLALNTFHRMYRLGEPELKDRILLPVWIFMALFTKGPVGLLVPPLSIFVFLILRGEWRKTGKYLGWMTWGILAGLSAIWILCAFLDGGPEYINNLLFKQTVGRAVNAFTHNKPFWFYFIAIIWCLAPYCILTIGSFIQSILPSRKASGCIPVNAVRSDTEVLFISVIASTFIMLSSFSSKLPVYLCPIFPFVVYLYPIVTERLGGRGWMKWAVGIPAGIFLVVAIVLVVALSGILHIEALDSVLAEYSFATAWPVKIAALVLLVGNAGALLMLVKRESWNLPVFIIGATLLLTVYCASGVMTKVNPYFGYRAMCSEVPEGTDVATLYVHRPENVDVYLGRQVTDYRKDVDSFINALAGREENVRPLTLIVGTKKMESNAALHDYVQSCRTVTYVGPYCLATK
ncbi:MAG: ArnT family glycosyltransferase, partial [Candidatus Cryptobacteroides sp.]